MRRLLFLLPLALLACTDEDASDTVIQGVTSTSTTSAPSTSTSTTSSTGSTPTTAFDGSTTPTSIASTASGVTQLVGVDVAAERVTFTFRDEVPGIDVKYVDPPITEDASGEEVHVAGAAFLSIRFEPSSGYDMEAGAPTYEGPDRLPGEGAVAEVVRTGDFEANLSWVIGLDAEVPFRVEVTDGSVEVLIAAS